MNASAGPASGPALRARPARWRPGTGNERIDVRRGDLPYERVIGYDPPPRFRPVDATQPAPSAGEPAHEAS